MTAFFTVYLIGITVLTLLMLARLFKNTGVIGFIDGRKEMYVDIAISYAVLGFISSVIVAKILGTKGGRNGH